MSNSLLLWRWLPLRLSKRQSLSTRVLSGFKKTIKFHLLVKWLQSSNLSLCHNVSPLGIIILIPLIIIKLPNKRLNSSFSVPRGSTSKKKKKDQQQTLRCTERLKRPEVSVIYVSSGLVVSRINFPHFVYLFFLISGEHAIFWSQRVLTSRLKTKTTWRPFTWLLRQAH